MWDRSAGHRRRCPWKHSLAVLQRRVLPAPVLSPKPAGCFAGAYEGSIPNPLMPWELGFGLTSAAGPEPAQIPALLTGEAARIHLERGTATSPRLLGCWYLGSPNPWGLLLLHAWEQEDAPQGHPGLVEKVASSPAFPFCLPSPVLFVSLILQPVTHSRNNKKKERKIL